MNTLKTKISNGLLVARWTLNVSSNKSTIRIWSFILWVHSLTPPSQAGRSLEGLAHMSKWIEIAFWRCWSRFHRPKRWCLCRLAVIHHSFLAMSQPKNRQKRHSCLMTTKVTCWDRDLYIVGSTANGVCPSSTKWTCGTKFIHTSKDLYGRNLLWDGLYRNSRWLHRQHWLTWVIPLITYYWTNLIRKYLSPKTLRIAVRLSNRY
jgi:hypothetical protein